MAVDSEQKRRQAAMIAGLPISRKPAADLDTASGRRTVADYDFDVEGPEVSLVNHGGVAAAKRPRQVSLSYLNARYLAMWRA